MVTICCWVTHCTDPLAGFATYKRASEGRGQRRHLSITTVNRCLCVYLLSNSPAGPAVVSDTCWC